MVKKSFVILGLSLLFVAALVQAAPQSAAPQSNAAQPGTPVAQQSAAEDVPGMALIPEGEFWMGRTAMFLFDELNWNARARQDDTPARTVWIDGFYMDKYEVTTTDYARFTDATNRAKPWHWKDGKVNPGQEKWPVYNVTWDDAVAYCAWSGKRLPTEAEWEKAARGGLDRKLYSWGDDLGAKRGAGAYAEEGGGQKKLAQYEAGNGPAPVGSFAANGYGLFDVTGNVWEWVSDWYTRDYYGTAPSKNPKGPDSGTYRVIRGGGWTNDEDLFNTGQRSLLGVHYRNYAPASQMSDAYGFRCAKDAPKKP